MQCHECGLLHRVAVLPPGTSGRCTRCGATLYKNHRVGLDGVVALYIAAAIFFIVAISFDAVSLNIEGQGDKSSLWSSVVALWREGMPSLAGLVFVFILAAPALKIVSALWIAVPLRIGRTPWLAERVMWVVDRLHPWSMLEVYLLGVLVAYVKLRDMADVEVGIALWAMAAAIVLVAAADSALDERSLWDRLQPQARLGVLRRRGGGTLIGCHVCDQVAAVAPHGGHARCTRCGSSLHLRKPESLPRAWALLLTGVILYVPANVYPVMTFVYLGSGQPQTILAGVSFLLHEGMWPLAALIFFASVLIPVMKILALAVLLASVQLGWSGRLRERTLLYRIVEGVGRWSMVDVFVIAILVSVVQLGALATITPGIGAIAFCLVVILTMLAALAFDPRLMWDAAHGRA